MSDPFWTPDWNPKWGPNWGPSGLEKIEKKNFSRKKIFVFEKKFYQIYRKTGPNLVLKFFFTPGGPQKKISEFWIFSTFHRFLG